MRSESLIPAEAAQAASDAIAEIMQQAAHPLSYAELGKAAVAALVEHGYAIVSAAPPRALEAPQGLESSGDGMRGHLAHADGSTGLSALRRAEKPESAITRYLRTSREET